MAGAKGKLVEAGVAGAVGFAQGKKAAARGAAEPGDEQAAVAGEATTSLQGSRQPGSSDAGAASVDPRAAAADGHGRDAESPAQLGKRGWKDVVWRTLKEVKADNVPITAAGVAFYAMLALVPALVAVVSVYGLVTSPAQAADQIRSFTADLPRDAASLIDTQLQAITQQSSGALSTKLVIALLGAVWSASSGVVALIRGLDVAYDETESRKFLKLRGRALLLTAAAVVGLCVVLGLLVALPAGMDAVGLGTVARWAGLVLRWPFLALLTAVAISAVYRFGPDRDQPKWRWVSWGGGVATLLWLGGTALFAVYVASFGKYDKTYGALAGVIILLLWLYLTALVVLVGAELNAELERQTLVDSTVGPDQPLGTRGAEPADTVGQAKPEKAKAGA